MNLVYIRVLFYFVAPILGMLPGVEYAADAGKIIIDLEAAAIGLAAAAGTSGAIFTIWGKK